MYLFLLFSHTLLLSIRLYLNIKFYKHPKLQIWILYIYITKSLKYQLHTSFYNENIKINYNIWLCNKTYYKFSSDGVFLTWPFLFPLIFLLLGGLIGLLSFLCSCSSNIQLKAEIITNGIIGAWWYINKVKQKMH